jgi:hypothetical protein
MLVSILDGTGNLIKVIVKGQETVVDNSGSITQTAQSQILLAVNNLRSGWLFQNNGSSPMTLNELGATPEASNSWTVLPNESFPPENFPVTVNAINIIGIAGDNYIAREW